jgi:hypothetical protein
MIDRSQFLTEFGRMLSLVAPCLSIGFLAALVPFFVGMCLDTLGWSALLNPKHPVRLRELIKTHVGTEALILSLPAGFAISDSLKILLLRRQAGVEGARTFASLLARRWMLGISQVVFITLAGIVAFLTFGDPSKHALAGGGIDWGTAFAILGLIVTALLFARALLRGKGVSRLSTLVRRIPSSTIRGWLARHEGTIQTMRDELGSLGALPASLTALVVGLYTLSWTADVFESILVARSLGITLTIPAALAIEAVLSVVKLAVFFLPSGIFVKDAGYLALFSSFHVAAGSTQALAFLFLKRSITVFWIVTGFFVLLTSGVAPSIRSLLSSRRLAEAT